MKLNPLAFLFFTISVATAQLTFLDKKRATTITTLRGGANGVFGTPITKETLAGLFIAEEIFCGSVCVPTPVEGAAQYGAIVSADSREAFCVQMLGYSNINNALCVFLSIWSNLHAISVPKLIGFASIPSTVATVNAVLTDNFHRHGLKKGLGLMGAILLTTCQILIFGSKSSTNKVGRTAAGALATLHLSLGLPGWLFPEMTAKAVGWDVSKVESERLFFKNSLSSPLATIGLMYSLLLKGVSPTTVAGVGSLGYAVLFLQGLLMGEDKATNMPAITFPFLFTYFGMIAVGLLLG